jgi:hypothetical protein
VATCDPAQGCTLVPATDGTPCGDGAACVSGVCAGEWLWREQVSTYRGTYRDLAYHTSAGRCVNKVDMHSIKFESSRSHAHVLLSSLLQLLSCSCFHVPHDS